jgi:hypothetical protein
MTYLYELGRDLGRADRAKAYGVKSVTSLHRALQERFGAQYDNSDFSQFKKGYQAGLKAKNMAKRNSAMRPSRATKRTVKKIEKRISAALSRFLKKQNPAFKKAAGVRVQKLKGGVIKLTPIRSNPATKRQARVIRGGANYWIVKRKSFVPGSGWYEQPDIVRGSKREAQASARAFKAGN